MLGTRSRPIAQLKAPLLVACVLLGALSSCGGSESVETATEARPTLALVESPLPTPTSALPTVPVELTREGIPELQVSTWSLRPAAQGGWEILGVLQNKGTLTYHELVVNADLLDGEGTLEETQHTLPLIEVLPGGARTPFRFHVEADDPPAHVVFWVHGSLAEADPIAGLYPSRFRVLRGEAQQVHLLGRISNAAGTPIRVHSAAGILLDSDGNPLAVAPASVFSRHLEPGDDGLVRISFPLEEVLAVEGLGHELFFQLEEAPNREPLPLKFEDPVDYLDSVGTLHLVGEVRNPSAQPVLLRLLAAIYDANGSVVDVAAAHSIYAPPGGSAFYDFDQWGVLDQNPGPYLRAESFSLQWDPGGSELLATQPQDLEVRHESQEVTDLGLIVIGVLEIPEALDGARILLSAVLQDTETGQLVAVENRLLPQAQIKPGSYSFEIPLPLPVGFDPGSGVVSLRAVLVHP